MILCMPRVRDPDDAREDDKAAQEEYQADGDLLALGHLQMTYDSPRHRYDNDI